MKLERHISLAQWAVWLIVLWANYAQASAIQPNPQPIFTDSEEARARYKQALAAIKHKRLRRFYTLQEQLKSHVLYPYLLFDYYRLNFDRSDSAQMLTFIQAYRDSPLSQRLKQHWLRYLFEQRDTLRFLTYYDPDTHTHKEFQCYYGRALWAEGRIEAAIRQGEKLWLTGQSQNSACDPLFEALQSAGHIDDSLRFERLKLAMNAENASLAKFLARDLTHPERIAQADRWLHLHDHPEYLTNPRAQFTDTPEDHLLIMHGFKRWLREDKDASLAALPSYLKRYWFAPELLETYLGFVGRYLSFSYHPQAYYWLTRVDLATKDRKILERRRMVAIQDAHWPGVITWSQSHWDPEQHGVNHLDDRYLYARALMKLAEQWGYRLLTLSTHTEEQSPHDLVQQTLAPWLDPTHPFAIFEIYPLGEHPAQLTQRALQQLTIAAAYRRYYGFLASEQLQQPLRLHAHETRYTQAQLASVSSLPGMQRARALFLLDDRTNATREFRFTLKRLNAQERAIAARVAHQWGWHFQAILAAVTSIERNNVDIRFPKAFHNYVGYFAHQQNIDADWVFAIMRQESAFKINARSHAGAVGLMQLMPSTAKYVARGLGLKTPSRQALLDPKINIQLGSRYLSTLRERFKGNLLLATAAYNAGPHRVDTWHAVIDKPMPGDLWVETVPFDETRNYLKNILTYQAIYKYQLGQQPRLTQDLLKPVQPTFSQPDNEWF